MIRVKLNKCQLKFSAPCKMGSVTAKDSVGFIIVFIGLFGAKVTYPLLLCAPSNVYLVQWVAADVLCAFGIP